MKNIKLILKYILIFVVLICMYFTSLILSSLIPSSAIKEKVIKSSEFLKQYGEKEIVNLRYKEEEIFLFTDALMLNTAYSIFFEFTQLYFNTQYFKVASLKLLWDI